MSLRNIRTSISRTMIANGRSWGSDSIDRVKKNGVDHILVKYE